MLLVFLSEHPNEKFHYNDLSDKLDIPKEYQKPVLNKLWHTGFIDAEQALKNPKIWIKPNGIEFANALTKENNKKERNEEIEKLNYEKLELDVHKLRDEIFDSPTLKRQRRISTNSAWISALSALLTLILLLIQWKRNKPG